MLKNYGTKQAGRTKTILAIDPNWSANPSENKSGVAVLNTATRQIQTMSLTFPQLCEKFACLNINETVVVIEGGWLVPKSCFHSAQGHRAEKVAKDVGANHQTGRLLAEMATYYGLTVEIQKPLMKCWAGKDRKITHEELASFIPSLPKRTNQDERDAALIAWLRAGYPIKAL